jgi:hypothetical protein
MKQTSSDRKIKVLLLASVVLGVIGEMAVRAQPPSAARASESDFSGVYIGARTIGEPADYAFTVAGQRAHAAYDPLVGDERQTRDCARESLPALLLADVVKTMQFVQEDGGVVMRFERDDAARTIHMDGARPSESQPHTELGYSLGRWLEGTLTIETTHLSGGFMFVDRGYPFSAEARVTERYTREPGQKDLRMELVIDDPDYYREPVRLEREWIWSPDEQVHPWNCVSLGPRGSEPVDIDEIRRRLEQL